MVLSYRRAERPKLIDHRHCKVCGKAIPPGEEFCSDECRQKYMGWIEKEKKTKRMIYVIYALIIASLFLFLFLRPFIGH